MIGAGAAGRVAAVEPEHLREMLVLASSGSGTERRLLPVLGVVVAVVVLLWAIDRFLARREQELMGRRGGDFAAVTTRFRLARRIFLAVVIAIGAIAVLQVVPHADAVARAALASGAVIALVIGLAVRAPIANLGAGLHLAFTQPFRIGDRITVGEETGIVEEVSLSYTVLRTDANRRVYLPNEQLVSTPISNATIDDPSRAETVTVPVEPRGDLERARAILLEEASAAGERLPDPQPTVQVGDVAPGAVTFEVTAWVADGAAAARLRSELRLRAVARLAAEGLLARDPGVGGG
jgi:small-conductance mechanosensitive channel